MKRAERWAKQDLAKAAMKTRDTMDRWAQAERAFVEATLAADMARRDADTALSNWSAATEAEDLARLEVEKL